MVETQDNLPTLAVTEIPVDEKINFEVTVSDSTNVVKIYFAENATTRCLTYIIGDYPLARVLVGSTTQFDFELVHVLNAILPLTFWVDWTDGVAKMGQGESVISEQVYDETCQIQNVVLLTETLASWELTWNPQGSFECL